MLNETQGEMYFHFTAMINTSQKSIIQKYSLRGFVWPMFGYLRTLYHQRGQVMSLETFTNLILPVAIWSWSTITFLAGKGARCVGLTILPPTWPIVRKSMSLNLLEPSWIGGISYNVCSCGLCAGGTHSICISGNSDGSKKLPNDGRLLPKHVGASILNKGLVKFST
jgi:hypothetical protein